MRALRHRKRAQQINAFNKSQAELARLTTSGRRPSLRGGHASQPARGSESQISTVVNSPSQTVESPISQQNDESDSQGLQSPGERSPGDNVEENVETLPPPLTLVGAAQTDPFNALPVSCTPKEYAFINHYISTLAHAMYRFSADGRLNPHRTFFVPAIQDPAAFHAILGISAAHMASLTFQRRSPEALAHTHQAIQMLNQRLSDPETRLSDGNLQTIVILTGMEDRFGSKRVARTHLDGARKLANLRGGFPAFKDSPMQAHLCWADFVHLEHEQEATIFEPIFTSAQQAAKAQFLSDARSELLQAMHNYQALAWR
ncbi:MAG: hypothetical protein Q9160_008522, partial [Pyrenula sp. 1 TL-2023]